jgi:GDP-4-dehydro-6-deoxy-D-mannose reductase
MTTALVTGARGFVGAHLVRAARESGLTVVEFDSAIDPSLDLRDAQRVRSVVERAAPDVVFHLAGLLRSPQPHMLYDVNIGGTVNLLEALAGFGGKVVVASSSAVYADVSPPAALTEECSFDPVSHYGASKVGQEAASRRFFTSHGLAVVLARSFNVVGPGQPSTLAAGAFAARIARAESTDDRTIQVGPLSGTRDFVDVRDVADAYLALARDGLPGQAYNVCSGVETSLRMCVDTLASRAAVPVSIVEERSAAASSGVQRQWGDTTKMTERTGWKAAISFEQSMADLLHSWRARVVVEKGGER